MASCEDLVEMSKCLTENPDNAIDGSDTKAEDNRARVSDVEKDENGSVVVTKRVVVETEPAVEPTLDVDSGLIDTKKDEKGVLSSAIVMNAVIRNDVEKVTKNGGNGKEQRVINGEEMEDSNDVFRVGDLVWGKIKSYPWWPGQIYDSKDASAFALKHSQEGCLLVAHFGDGSCSWCLPSQLVPFVDNFEQMSMDSSLKSFMNAKQSAVDEIGRLVEYNMLCKCIPSDKKAGLARPVVSNFGIKKGVLVPDVDIRRLSIPKYEPARIHEKLMSYAKCVDVDSLLEVVVLKSCLSALYCLKGGGYRLPEYCEPVFIEGLEDKNKTVTASAGDFSFPIEVPMLSPFLKGDWLNSRAVKSEASPDDIVYHRRKQKSIVDQIMEENGYSVIEPKSQKGAKVRDKSASFRGKRRKSNATEESVDGVEKGQLSGKGGKKRKSLKSQEDDFKTPKAAKTGVAEPGKSKSKKSSEFSFADAAFKSSITESLFGVENVNYWLQRSSDGSKARPKNPKRASEDPDSSQEMTECMSDISVIKQKLEIMTTAILENYHSKFSTEEKMSLNNEMKQLRENVEMVTKKVRVTAEKRLLEEIRAKTSGGVYVIGDDVYGD